MSIKLMSQVWELDLPQNEKIVLLCFADFADDSGRCWPSIRRVAWKTGYSPRNMKRIVNALRQKGLLEEIRAAAPHFPTIYRVNPDRGDKLSPLESIGSDTPVTPGVTNCPSRGDTPVTQTTKEPSLNRQGERAPAREVPKGWKPAAETVTQAETEKLPHSPANVSKFISLARSKGSTFVDVDAGYLLFLQREVEFNRGGGNGNGNGSRAGGAHQLRDKNDSELYRMAQDRGLHTHGKSRDELITAITRHDAAAAREVCHG
ncbi:MAG: helix-turn-helix domain-containing protein [Xanthomonadales bacterium]|nr:helix-turn-helix domain-containing protein [Xanthomonadales bacterium]